MFPIDIKRHSTLLRVSALMISKLDVIRVHRGNGISFMSLHPAEKNLPDIGFKKKKNEISKFALQTNVAEHNISL